MRSQPVAATLIVARGLDASTLTDHGETQTRIIYTNVEVSHLSSEDLAAGRPGRANHIRTCHHITHDTLPLITTASLLAVFIMLSTSQCLEYRGLSSGCSFGGGSFDAAAAAASVVGVCTALPPILTDDFLDTASSPSSILVAEEAIDRKAIIMEKAFQDSVDFFDVSGPLGTVLIVTFAALACSVGFFIVSTDS
jgi:hypothetical protein